MSTQITPLRQRMIDDMMIRNMSPSTQKIYAQAVANFSIYHRRSPDKLTFEDVRDYRLHLIARGLKATSINPIIGALRFFYATTLGQKQVSEQIPYARRADTLPAVLAPAEVVRFLKAVPNLKMRTANTVNRLLLMSSSERHLSSVPMAFFIGEHESSERSILAR